MAITSVYNSSPITQAMNEKMQGAGVKKLPVNESFSISATSRANAAQEASIHNLLVDTDGDGKISALEKNAHANDLLAHKEQIDKNGDGKISFQEELRWALDSGDITRDEVTRFLDTDTNKDGVLSNSEKISYAMRSIVAAQQQPKKEKKLEG